MRAMGQKIRREPFYVMSAGNLPEKRLVYILSPLAARQGGGIGEA